MSTFSSNESRFGSTWLQFLKRRRSTKEAAPTATEGSQPFLSLVESVRTWAAESPNATAVATATETLSYAELETQSNALARHLQSLGAAPETLVALVLDRSPEFAIAALATWKAGAAYLPIDPACPPERIRLILDDARAPVLIRSGLASQIELSQESARQVDISDRHSLLRAYSSRPLPASNHPSQLAYVIYTSGSTGRPKGVEITHGNLLNLVHWHQSAFAISSSDRATMLASPGFDAAVWEIRPYLSAGASLCAPPETTRVSPRSLRDWMLAQRITVSFVPTPLAQRLIFLQWPTETSLRFLLTGADVLQQYPPAGLPFTLVNNYGPTECTVVALSGTVTPYERPAALPPVGRPISNTQIRLLDDDSTIPNSRVKNSYQTPSTPIRVHASIKQATSPALFPMAISNSSAVPTIKSRSAATVSNPMTFLPRYASTTPFNPASSFHAKILRESIFSLPTSF